MSVKKQRVYILDALRGLAVLGMIVHHSLESFMIVFGENYYEYREQLDFVYTSLKTDAFKIVQLVFVAIFLLVSGICTNYSRNVLKRGIVVFSAAMLLTVATCWVIPKFGLTGLNIYFGILHMFGLSMILYWFFQKALKKINPIVGAILSLILFILYYIYYKTEPVSESWLTLPFGIIPSAMTSYGDYYPLFPYFFMFLMGTFVGRYIQMQKFPKWFYSVRVPVLEFVGRNSLLVYVLHQPIIFPIMLIVYNLL